MEAMLQVPHPIHGTPAFISQLDAATITGRTRRTVQRWIRAQAIQCPTALALLQIHAHGLLPAPWRGWSLHGEHLVSPDGAIALRQQDLATAYLHVGLIRELRQRCQALETALDATQKRARRPLVKVLLGG